jgi:hypothetical protein
MSFGFRVIDLVAAGPDQVSGQARALLFSCKNKATKSLKTQTKRPRTDRTIPFVGLQIGECQRTSRDGANCPLTKAGGLG